MYVLLGVKQRENGNGVLGLCVWGGWGGGRIVKHFNIMKVNLPD